MSASVSITGIGLITPLGSGASSTWNALLAGHYISDHSTCGHCNIFQLAHSAAVEAIADAGWTSADERRTGLVVGTSKGAIKSWIDQKGVQPGIASVAEALRPLLPFHNILTFSAACASGLHALIRGVLMIQNSEADRVLVVAAEASVHPLFLGSFQRLGVLARPEVGCRPFDQDREGFLMSEAAAAVCLKRVSSGYATIDRFGLGGDSTNLVGSDPEATTLRRLLKQVVVEKPIDVIHAHGTGTVVNDAIEVKAIESAFTASPMSRERDTDAVAALYSHKGALGHSLGAAGLVAVVLNAMMHRHGTVPGNVRTYHAMKSAFAIPNQMLRTPIQRSVAIASGFGGAVAVVGMKSPNEIA